MTATKSPAISDKFFISFKPHDNRFERKRGGIGPYPAPNPDDQFVLVLGNGSQSQNVDR